MLRITFLSKFNLSRSFDFGRYITIAEECNIIHMLEVSAAQWAMFLGILVPICIAFKYTPSDAYDSYMERRCSDYRDDVDMSTFNKVLISPVFPLVLPNRFVILLVSYFCSANRLGTSPYFLRAAAG